MMTACWWRGRRVCVLAGIEDCGSGGHGIGLGGGWGGVGCLCARDLKCKMWVLLFHALPFDRGCHT